MAAEEDGSTDMYLYAQRIVSLHEISTCTYNTNSYFFQHLIFRSYSDLLI